ncbi:hypothetical protein [Aliterella atlantica]|uniref:Uncharacterized protein n=1 Tax=Aliterella atlantica CENA595 TaxID=1618023 RepID=A0A0D8ZL97_9CYAN|nr:hypothetical protein [Aliterella atlantica]KJH69510.1 hypothetical protein UH38_23430 [Aliterella atlantica CENA595]
MTYPSSQCKDPANRNLFIAIAQLIIPIVNNQPRTIQMFFDGVEVLRIEDGKKRHEILFPADHQPELMELGWDGELVYAISPAS